MVLRELVRERKSQYLEMSGEYWQIDRQRRGKGACRQVSSGRAVMRERPRVVLLLAAQGGDAPEASYAAKA